MIIDPDDGSRLRYHVTGTAVAVRLDDGSLVDRFTLPDDVADDDVTLWMLAHHHDTLSHEGWLG
jgi:hypothetical protein